MWLLLKLVDWQQWLNNFPVGCYEWDIAFLSSGLSFLLYTSFFMIIVDVYLHSFITCFFVIIVDVYPSSFIGHVSKSPVGNPVTIGKAKRKYFVLSVKKMELNMKLDRDILPWYD